MKEFKILKSVKLIFFKFLIFYNKKEITCCFDLLTAATNKVEAMLKIMSKFVFC